MLAADGKYHAYNALNLLLTNPCWINLCLELQGIDDHLMDVPVLGLGHWTLDDEWYLLSVGVTLVQKLRQVPPAFKLEVAPALNIQATTQQVISHG